MQKGIRLLGLGLLLIFISSCGYNQMVSMDEEVNNAWSQVINVYDYRANLAPQLITAIKKSEGLPVQTVKDLEAAAGKAKKALEDKKPTLTKEYLDEMHETQKKLTKLLEKIQGESRVSGSKFSNYIQNDNPEFEDLLNSLLGAEGRIKKERKKYNDQVSEYNMYIRKFPQSASSGIMGFDDKPYFGQ